MLVRGAREEISRRKLIQIVTDVNVINWHISKVISSTIASYPYENTSKEVPICEASNDYFERFVFRQNLVGCIFKWLSKVEIATTPTSPRTAITITRRSVDTGLWIWDLEVWILNGFWICYLEVWILYWLLNIGFGGLNP